MTQVFILFSLNIIIFWRGNTIQMWDLYHFSVLHHRMPHIRFCWNTSQFLLIHVGQSTNYSLLFIYKLFYIWLPLIMRCFCIKRLFVCFYWIFRMWFTPSLRYNFHQDVFYLSTFVIYSAHYHHLLWVVELFEKVFHPCNFLGGSFWILPPSNIKFWSIV